MFLNKTTRRVLATLAATSIALPGAAATLEISVTNTASIGGLAITPLWAAFHDGSFDSFEAGSAASAGVEQIAEVGDPSLLGAELAAADPSGHTTVIAAPMSGPPTIDPGESTSATIKLSPSGELYFSFLSMLVPSNDTFLGNDSPTGYRLFDSFGDFTGDLTIDVTGAFLYDAGTEVNDPTGGPAFVVGQVGSDGAPEGGVIHGAESLAAFGGVATPLGNLDPGLIDFTSDPAGFGVARITISEVSPVPLPASAPLLLAGVGFTFLAGRRRRAAT